MFLGSAVSDQQVVEAGIQRDNFVMSDAFVTVGDDQGEKKV